ncbi:MAG: hypothetical protein A3F17_09015 [Gammaproteobacteria bacterium RIFCSPHIGHO2_12_FULL_41_15]|nr:MAG: hypothetical protein A3F17_09015 [Gammaproteobacteria bacterium RIFCSPHIGHO2_12_FULL_41_15]
MLIFKGMTFWIFLWLAFVIYYALSLKYNIYTAEADYVAYFTQMVADFLIVIFSTLAFLKNNNKKIENILFSDFYKYISGNNLNRNI